MFRHYFSSKIINYSIFILFIFISVLVFQFLPKHFHTKTNNQQKSFLKTLNQQTLRFEKNLGQSNSDAPFLYRDNALGLELSSNEVVLSLRQSLNEDKTKTKDVSTVMRLLEANRMAEGEGIDELITKTNYFIGNDPENWRTNIPNFKKVRFAEVYPGIDLLYYGNNGNLEYDFNISPRADPGKILLQFEKEVDAILAENGDLVLHVGDGLVTMQAPLAYQEVGGACTNIETHFKLQDEYAFGFEVEEYDQSIPLIIDPKIIYSTFLGIPGTGEDVVVDKDGFIYIAGTFGTQDAFVVKFHPDSSSLIYKTFLGGELDDFGKGVAVDADGNVYVTGETQSDDFPVEKAVQPSFGGDLWASSDAFITKLDTSGKIVYSTYLGGGSYEIGHDIAVDPTGHAYITGETNSQDFPVVNAYQENQKNYDHEAFITKINADGSAFLFSTYLGGNYDDEGHGIALDEANNIYVTGVASSDFPTTAGAYNTERPGAFVTKMNAQGTDLVFSTYLPGGTDPNFPNYTEGMDIAVDDAHNVVIQGWTWSPDFPTVNAIQPDNGGQVDNFVAKFSHDGSSLIFSTYLGGSHHESDFGSVALDSEGNIFVTGRTQSDDFPLENPLFGGLNGQTDAFVTGIRSDGQKYIISSYLGGESYDEGHGIFADENGNIFVTGKSISNDFPLESPMQTGGTGSFLTKIEIEKREDTLVVEVLQDSLKHQPVPVANTELDIYSIDLSKPKNPFTYLEKQTTDNKGLLHLPAKKYVPGQSFLLKKKVYSLPAVKQNHEIVDDIVYDVYVDNLNIDETGKITADVFELNKNDTTHTHLEHTWVGFNLVVSIEWLASDHYVNELKSAFLNGSNYLYDITNGQACLQKIAIYDNRSKWYNADILIHASNLEWPRANVDGYEEELGTCVYMPPQHFGGNKTHNINLVYNEPLAPDSYYNYCTIIHELGHYLLGFYDEYINVNRELIYPNKENTQPYINFGFMDDNINWQDSMSSEMSAYETPEYRNTRQFTKRNSTCWEYFRSKFRNVASMVRAEVHTPRLLGINSNRIVAGPLSNEFGVGSALKIIDKTGADGGKRLEYLVKDENGHPLAGVVVLSEKTNMNSVKEGKTVLSGPNKGKIRLFAAKPGDKLYFSFTEKPTNYFFLETIAQSSGAQLYKNNNEETTSEVVLKTVQGKFKLLSEVKFISSGELEYNSLTHSNFNNTPSLRIIENETAVKDFSLTSESDGYTTTLPGDIGHEGAICMLKAPDSSGTSFFITQDLNVLELDENLTHLVPSQNNVELWLDPESQSLSKLAVLGSNFPGPTTGIPDSVIRASNIFAINQQPITEVIKAYVRIFYDADTLGAANPYAVTIYHWKDIWQPMPTNVNLELSYASTHIEEPGFYAAYLDLTQSVILTSIKDKELIEQNMPKGFELYQNYPNPFNPVTTFSYLIPEKGASSNVMVQLIIYDVLGKEVKQLVNEIQKSGKYEFSFDASKLTSGIYFYRIIAGDYSQTKK